MTKEDIKQTVADFVLATKNAVEAGFDGVEIHGMQFTSFLSGAIKN